VSAGFLLDTNVVSATAPPRGGQPSHESVTVRIWLERHRRSVYLPAVVIGEIAAGIGRLDAAGASKRAADFGTWLEAMHADIGDRVLPLDAAAALLIRGLSAAAQRGGVAPGFADLAIAAIARRHDLTVATRNTKHFAPMRVPTVDPFAA
jgi:toxin FitB